jgi:DNA-binding response OmpR family regulator
MVDAKAKVHIMSTIHPPQVTILAVEDEPRSQRLLRVNLEPLGYRIVLSDRAADVEQLVEMHEPDLVLLDIDLPDGDGFHVCERLRARFDVPIIFVSAYDQPTYKARGLGLGGDDYIGKPYDPIELVARIDAVLRRVQGRPLASPAVFHCGPLAIDFGQHRVMLDGVEVPLSRTEYRLLEYLAQNAGRTIVADTLVTKVWGDQYLGDYASLHLYISRLRRKLGEDSRNPRYILTKPGIGYTMPVAAYALESLRPR